MPSRMIPFTIITVMAVAFMWMTKGKDSSSFNVEGLPILEAEELKEQWKSEKLVLVNFWATWCGPCEAEIPDLVKLQKNLRDQGLKVALVNLEHPDSKSETLNFLKRYEAAQMGYIKPAETENFFQTLGFEAPAGLPISGLWSPQSGLIKQWAGVKSLEELELEVKAHLE